MRKLIFASNNAHKLKEVRQIFDKYEVLSLRDIGFTNEIIEDGLSFEENARIKAEAVMKFVKEKLKVDYAVISDDSGLCVKALNYEPGIMSARYSGGGDAENRKKLLQKLLTIQDRTAYFQCYAVLLFPDDTILVEDGKVYGLITKDEIGDKSFGYDCIFWANSIKKTFGQATEKEKNEISHRAIAMKKLKDYLDSINYRGVDNRELF